MEEGYQSERNGTNSVRGYEVELRLGLGGWRDGKCYWIRVYRHWQGRKSHRRSLKGALSSPSQVTGK